MRKRIASALLALAVCLTLLPTAAWAAEDSTDTWDGTADTSWYTGHESDSEYHITTAEQLAGLAQLVNADKGKTNFAGKTFYLDNDLDLAGHEWISIGTGRGGQQANYSFCGSFDGQGHVVSNLYSRDSYTDGYDEANNVLRNALFGNVYNGEVKNLGVADAKIWIDPNDDSAAGKGILVDWMNQSKITNCWTSGSIYSGSKIEKNIGGIVGVALQNCTISGCYSTATLTGNFTNSDGYYDETDPDEVPCDTIGGIIGAKFAGNLTITDCWFDGKIVVNSKWAAVGGIIGYSQDYYGILSNTHGLATVKNCMVITTDIGADSGVNTCWVAYDLDGTVEDNYWPNSDKYNALPREGTAGTAVSNFNDEDVLSNLQTNASTGVKWVAGIHHPTFSWDDNNILADYTAVDEAIAAADAVDQTLYSNYSAVKAAIDNVDREKSKAQQSDVNAMAQAIRDAIAALEYKSADYTAVDAALTKAEALNPDDYKDFSAVTKAMDAVVRGKNITQQADVDAMARAIEAAITGLEKKSSSSGGSSAPSYAVSAPASVSNGTVTTRPKNAYRGDTVTVTVKPDVGYVLDSLTVTDAKGNALTLTDKGDGKYTFTMPGGAVRISARFAPEAVEPDPEPVSFQDVPESAYYAPAVRWAAQNGVTGGVADGLFGSDQPCTRAQIITFLWRAAGSPASQGSAKLPGDVSGSAYYAQAVLWALENGVASGTGPDAFSPDAPCTRAQSVTFLFRAAGSPASAAASSFRDVAAADYFAPAVTWAQRNSVTSGVGSGQFGPHQTCTRAQIITFLFAVYGQK